MFTKSALEEEEEEIKRAWGADAALTFTPSSYLPVAQSHGGMTRSHQFSLMTPAAPLSAHFAWFLHYNIMTLPLTLQPRSLQIRHELLLSAKFSILLVGNNHNTDEQTTPESQKKREKKFFLCFKGKKTSEVSGLFARWSSCLFRHAHIPLPG